MPPAPKLASFPAIRGALKFYQVCSIITGTMLLLLVAEMIIKYVVGYELFLGRAVQSVNHGAVSISVYSNHPLAFLRIHVSPVSLRCRAPWLPARSTARCDE